jgi:hypothetical protein
VAASGALGAPHCQRRRRQPAPNRVAKLIFFLRST